MNKRGKDILNIATIVTVLVILVFSWFYIREQFMWGVILSVVILMVVSLANLVTGSVGRQINRYDALAAFAIIIIATSAWFYFREQFSWAVILITLIIIYAGYLHLKKMSVTAPKNR
jgi:uncharacterized protein (DUF486 family)